MPTTNLRAAKRDWLALRKHFASSFRHRLAPETGAIGLLGESSTTTQRDLLLADIIWPQDDDIRQASSGALIFSSTYLRRAHTRMRRDGLFGLVTFHTHPGSDRYVGFSPFDDAEDPQLIENLQEIEPATCLLSVVVGKSSQFGRLWLSPESSVVGDRLIVVGDSLSYLSLRGAPDSTAPPPSAVFDRALAVTGHGALAALASMRIAIVGASGTGSIIGELLARAGCTDLLAIDDDTVEEVNLNRILHATQHDVAQSTPKVEVMKRGIEGLGLGCTVEAVNANVLDRDILRHVLSTDLVFGCVDRALPRRVLSQLAHQYLLPYIDVGSEIGGDERGIVSVDARTSYVAPGYACLMCAGLASPRQLHFESLSYEEQQREINLGYSDDLVIKQPAVMDLNMRAASYGMIFLRHLLQPFLLPPLPGTLSESLVTYAVRAIHKPRALSPDCRTCQLNPVAGYGDRGAPLGFCSRVVASITRPR